MVPFQFVSADLDWFGHTAQEVELKYELEWQEVEFTERQFNTVKCIIGNEVLLYSDPQKVIY